jgi:hypothetical protein
MVRTILGVIAGFIVWSVVWVGVHTVLTILSPGWYGVNHREFEQAAQAGLPFMSKTSMVLSAFVLSLVCSVTAGFVAALVARENTTSTLILGILLLLVGLFVEISYWQYFPIWYHFLFLFFLIPVTILGGKLKKT